MQLRNAVPSPSFQAVLDIAQHAGRGMTVARFETIRFPTGTVQVWELTPHAPASAHDAAAALVVAVFLKGRGINGWKPMPAGLKPLSPITGAGQSRKTTVAQSPWQPGPNTPPLPREEDDHATLPHVGFEV